MPQYLVRLPIQVTGDNPAEAVQLMIEELTHKGLRNWQYKVDLMNEDGTLGDSAGVFDGFSRSAERGTSDTTATIEDDADDSELVRFADALNTAPSPMP